MSRYEMKTPPPEPVPFKGTHRFPCKWCGETLHVTDGLIQVHECTVYHSTNEHFSYVAEQIRIHEGMPSAQEHYDSMHTEAAAVLVQFDGREPMYWPAATIDVESASEDRVELNVTRAGHKEAPMTIAEFLLARVAEDEAAAREVESDFQFNPSEPLDSSLEVFEPGYDTYPVITISRTRVLAECAAKRAIIEDWEDPTDGGPWVADGDAGHVLATDHAVRALAAVYADHKDYRPEWAA